MTNGTRIDQKKNRWRRAERNAVFAQLGAGRQCLLPMGMKTRPRSWSGRGLAVNAALLVLAAADAHAQRPPTTILFEAPADCPTREDFVTDVQARLTDPERLWHHDS